MEKDIESILKYNKYICGIIIKKSYYITYNKTIKLKFTNHEKHTIYT